MRHKNGRCNYSGPPGITSDAPCPECWPEGDGGYTVVTEQTTQDEHALLLFMRMLTGVPVWVDSPAGQQTWIHTMGVDQDGEMVAWDATGQDRGISEYLLTDPGRSKS